jgi:hypothetical protein
VLQNVIKDYTRKVPLNYIFLVTKPPIPAEPSLVTVGGHPKQSSAALPKIHQGAGTADFYDPVEEQVCHAARLA